MGTGCFWIVRRWFQIGGWIGVAVVFLLLMAVMCNAPK